MMQTAPLVPQTERILHRSPDRTEKKPGNNPFSAGGMNPMDMLMGMLSPDQQSMFQMFQSDFNTEAASTGNTDMQDSPPEREQ